MNVPLQRVQVIDSHTGGEPTRTVISGGPDLGGGTVAEQLVVFRETQDAFRRAVVNEPRGNDVIVGALLVPPSDPTCTAGVIFFNNVGYLGMCGHGTLGVVITLGHQGRIQPGPLSIETPAGVVQAHWEGGNKASLTNVPAFLKAQDVTVQVPGLGEVTGDVAWGGNWFFLVTRHGEELSRANIPRLLEVSGNIRQAVNEQGHPEVDHVELFGPPQSGGHSRNFVLCPGGAYDRSPCGTGTSAKLASLATRGLLGPDIPWVQESIIGSTFTACYTWLDREAGTLLPRISGTAHVCAEATLLLDATDPFCWGIR
ncbi:proline racemase family protein [Verrucomicrobium sp. BvORR106]|uniref:proline racemase family protein n=1 Tax=Verrucomicrobium sp. BvORR106 TaxID=1403819 RepID=UPI0005715447|nr:proline racemase family protein [Verrucomicrobium sp. BvORR106]